MNFTELLTPRAVAANWTEAQSNKIPYLGATLFPSDKQAGLDMAFLKGHRGVPISLMPSAFDAKATFRDRIGFVKLESEMPFFREGYKVKERDRQDLLRARDITDPYAKSAIARIYDDSRDLIDSAEVVAERMRMQLLFPLDGKPGISIRANGMDYTYNYDQDGEWFANNYTALTGADLWTASATADPFKHLQQIKDAVAGNSGGAPAIAIMNTTTFNMMAATDAVKNRWLTTTGRSMGYLTAAEARKVIEETVGLRVAIYDKQYRDEDKIVHKFVPDGYVALIPEGDLGRTVYGTTPEEADLMGSAEADVSIVNTGVALTRVIQAHPVNIDLFASEIVLPSFERMDEVAVLKVIA